MKYKKYSLGPLASNCYLIYDEKSKETAIFDVGGKSEELKQFIRDENLDVKYIFLTHAHFDHILGAEDLSEFTGARIYVHEDDADMLKSADLNSSRTIVYVDEVEIHDFETFKSSDVFELADLEISFLHTPGHTKGSICAIIGDFLVTGDTLFRGTIGRTDLYGGSRKLMTDSLKKISSLNRDYLVLPGHGEESSLELEFKINPYLKRKPKF